MKIIFCPFVLMIALLLPVSTTNAQQDSGQGGLEGVEQVEGELGTEANTLSLKQTKSQINRQRRTDLDAQFERIQKLKKTENAYSEKLGEEYLSYGLLLKQAGEIDEARNMMVDALHISKVNDGVYGIEQRPILRALFKIDSLLGNSEKMEEDFAKIEWLEIKNSDHIGTHSLDIMVELGHHFLDRYSIQTSKSDASLALLNTAANYFSRAINRYSFKVNDPMLMPYGELLEVYLYRVKLLERFNGQQGFIGRREGGRGDPIQRAINQQNRFDSIKERDRTVSQIKSYSHQYLEKAKSSKNRTEVVSALLAMADWNLLLKRKNIAANYYRLAWEEAQKLAIDDPSRLSFNNPVRLPAFNHSYKNEEARLEGATYGYFPVVVSIGADGKVDQVEKITAGVFSQKNASRARRIIKNSKFRPAIIDGEMMASDQYKAEIRILISKK